MKANATSISWDDAGHPGNVEEHLNRIFGIIEKDGGKVKSLNIIPKKEDGVMIFVVLYEEGGKPSPPMHVSSVGSRIEVGR